MPGSWTIVHAPARFAVNLMLLLTDGRVLAFEGGGSRCATLTPDLHGSYEDGFWDERASMTHSRLYFESAVFADGGVYVGGGEYGTGNVSVELYDPVTDDWRDGQLPPWPYLSDEPCCLLSDGTLLAGFQQRSGIYSPTTDSWTEIAVPMSGDCYETTWTLLRDGSVLQPYMLSHPNSQRFLPDRSEWVDAGEVPADLVPSAGLEEVGPALLLYDGCVLEFGATGHTDFYAVNERGGSSCDGRPGSPAHSRRDPPGLGGRAGVSVAEWPSTGCCRAAAGRLDRAADDVLRVLGRPLDSG